MTFLAKKYDEDFVKMFDAGPFDQNICAGEERGALPGSC